MHRSVLSPPPPLLLLLLLLLGATSTHGLVTINGSSWANGDFPYTDAAAAGTTTCTGPLVAALFAPLSPSSSSPPCVLLATTAPQIAPGLEFTLVVPWTAAKAAGCNLYKEVIPQALALSATLCAIVLASDVSGQVGYADGEPFGTYPWIEPGSASNSSSVLLTELNLHDGASLLAVVNTTGSAVVGTVTSAPNAFTIMYAQPWWNAVVWIFFALYVCLIVGTSTSLVLMAPCVAFLDRSPTRIMTMAAFLVCCILRALEIGISFYGMNPIYPRVARSFFAYVVYTLGFYVFAFIIITYDHILAKVQMMKQENYESKSVRLVKRVVIYIAMALLPILTILVTIVAAFPWLNIISLLAFIVIGATLIVVFGVSLSTGVKLFLHLHHVQSIVMDERAAQRIRKMGVNVILLNSVFIVLIVSAALVSVLTTGAISTTIVAIVAVITNALVAIVVCVSMYTILSVRVHSMMSSHGRSSSTAPSALHGDALSLPSYHEDGKQSQLSAAATELLAMSAQHSRPLAAPARGADAADRDDEPTVSIAVDAAE